MVSFKQESPGVFIIQGNLFLELLDVDQIKKQLVDYAQNPEATTILHYEVGHIGGDEALQFMVEVYQVLKSVPHLDIYWVYSKYDLDMEECAQDIIVDLGIPLILRPL